MVDDPGFGKKQSPKYELVAELLKKHKDQIVIAEADADKHLELGYRYGINGFPSFKWYPKGTKSTDEVEVTPLGTDVVQVLEFIKEKTGIEVKVSKKKLDAVAGVVTITPDNVDKIIGGPKNAMVKFYSTCGIYSVNLEHCHVLAPKFDKAADDMGKYESLVFGEVDIEKYPKLASKFGVKRAPVIKWFYKNNYRPAIDYTGEFETEKIKEYATLIVSNRFVNVRDARSRRQGGRSQRPRGGNCPRHQNWRKGRDFKITGPSPARSGCIDS